MPSSAYAVLWMPRSTYHEVVLLMQTHSIICGLARIGDRHGVRCLKAHEEELHKLLRPTVAWVDRSKLKIYEAGPWPFGTQKSNIVKALSAFGEAYRAAKARAAASTRPEAQQQTVAKVFAALALAAARLKPAPVSFDGFLPKDHF
eukprot:s927_g4.t1